MQVLSVVRTAGSGDPGEALEPRGAEEEEARGDEGGAVRCSGTCEGADRGGQGQGREVRKRNEVSQHPNPKTLTLTLTLTLGVGDHVAHCRTVGNRWRAWLVDHGQRMAEKGVYDPAHGPTLELVREFVVHVYTARKNQFSAVGRTGSGESLKAKAAWGLGGWAGAT